jgi:hypothetical protein
MTGASGVIIRNDDDFQLQHLKGEAEAHGAKSADSRGEFRRQAVGPACPRVKFKMGNPDMDTMGIDRSDKLVIRSRLDRRGIGKPLYVRRGRNWTRNRPSRGHYCERICTSARPRSNRWVRPRCDLRRSNFWVAHRTAFITLPPAPILSSAHRRRGRRLMALSFDALSPSRKDSRANASPKLSRGPLESCR